MHHEERRRVLRLRIPARAEFASTKVQLADLSIAGARLESDRRIASGTGGTLTFHWRETEVVVTCHVQRCRLDRFENGHPVYDIGVSFNEQSRQIAAMMSAEVSDLLEKQRANAEGVLPPVGQTFGEQLARHAASAARKYTQYVFDGSRFRKAHVENPLQPPDGFTVSTAEDERQVELLCATYRRADDSGRGLIRRLAAMTISVSDAADHRSGNAA